MSSKKSPSDDVDVEFDNEDVIDRGNDDNNNTNQQDDVMMDMLSSIMQHQEQHQQAASSSSSNNNAAVAASVQLSDSAAILQMLQQMNVREMEQGSDKKKPHTFWDTQVSVVAT